MKVRGAGAFYTDIAPARYFSIEPGRPFLSDLADGMIAAFGDDLPRAEIFVPTRRAARNLADAFIEARGRAGVRATLLPRLRPIGDIDDDEVDLFSGSPADEVDLPPAISGPARLIALARLVAAKEKAFAGQENWPAALAAARELGKLLDSFHAEEIDPARIDEIDVGDRARHWQVSAAFLKIVTAAWPAFLESQGLCDPAWRRAALIGAMARRLAAQPPQHPVLVAGTTASAPAVARLVAAVASAPLGAAVLPGLDRNIDASGYEKVRDAHPQYGLKRFLDEAHLRPADIAPWPGSERASARSTLLRLALRPADATDDWPALIARAAAEDRGLAAACDGLSLVEADTEDAEASIIAMLFRETLETADATAMLVTPDRALGRRVALKMQRWGVTVDDSGGVPFANTQCGAFLRLAAGFLENAGDAVAILALLRHPLAQLGLNEIDRRRGVDALDRLLRGPARPDALSAAAAAARGNDEPNAALLAVIAALADAAAGFRSAPRRDFSGLLRAHLRAAETLAGGAALWSGDDGAAGAALLAEILEEADALEGLQGARYADVFDALIAGAAVRRRSDAHPRLSILGPLEARMMSADHVILGGLNEGIWPQIAPADPFLSRTMRETLRLPAQERRIGLAAHDFAQGAASPRVTLTRSLRAGGDPAKPSRWIVRLRNILKGAGAVAAVDQSALWRARAALLDDAGPARPVDPPRPRAGPGRRPAALSVTQIETWIRDPYAIYARHLLKLRKIDDPGVEPDARVLGLLLHRVFERAASAPAALALGELRTLVDEEAPNYGLAGADRAFCDAALDASLAWFCGFDAAQRADRTPYVEKTGTFTIPGIEPPFTLTARADRIDLSAEGGAVIIDFKTGVLPTDDQEKVNFTPQLPLTGLVLENGSFDAVPKARVDAYRYLKALNRSDDDDKNAFGKEGEEASAAIAGAEAALRAFIARFDAGETTYASQPRAQFVKHIGDYDQLARRREWSASDDTEADAE